jgi:hypothetical protein
MEPSDPTLSLLMERAARDHERWINGDASGYALPDEGTILGAVGGYARGGPETAARQVAVAAQWLRGSGSIEFLNGGVSEELAWLAFLERSRVVLQGEDRERRWDLRVTEIFRRDGDGWHRVHRHADPLVNRRSVAAAADLVQDSNGS